MASGFDLQKTAAVFFDFEGTLVDFQWQLSSAVEETLAALARVGFPKGGYGSTPDYAFIYNQTLHLSSQGIGRVSGPSARRVIDEIFDRFDQDALTRWRLYPDTAAVLSALKQTGMKLAVISNIGKTSLTAALDRFNILGLMNEVVSRDEMARIKPDPNGLLITADRLGLSPNQVLFVGDSRNDVAAAHAAGMGACYLSGGENTPEQVIALSPEFSITTLTRLPKIWGIKNFRHHRANTQG